MGVVVIIPTRLDSTRFPGKALVPIHGKTLIQRCYESVVLSGFQPFVATHDQEIINEVHTFGGEAIRTTSRPRNGTERVAEAANLLGIPDDTVVVNCQGDQFGWNNPEFLFRPIEALDYINKDNMITTVYDPMYDNYDLCCVNSVKVLCRAGQIDFSRSLRDGWGILGIHYGVYAAEKRLFDEYYAMPKSRREVDERLEQLRWPYQISAWPVIAHSHKIDTHEDLRNYLFEIRNQKEEGRGPDDGY